MADLRIVDAPVLLQESITDDVKMPTGWLGNYAIRLGDLVWYVVAKENLASKSYVDTSSKGVKDSLDVHVADKNNPHQVTKTQVGLGNVDNTADVDKPVSNATKSTIITATTDMATKTYVNQKDNLKADKATTLSGYGITDAYTKAETYSRTEIDDVVSLKANTSYVDDKDGDLTTLVTNNKTNLVKAINELHETTEGVVALYDKNVEAGAGAKGWTANLIIDSASGKTQHEINSAVLQTAYYASLEGFKTSIDNSDAWDVLQAKMQDGDTLIFDKGTYRFSRPFTINKAIKVTGQGLAVNIGTGFKFNGTNGIVRTVRGGELIGLRILGTQTTTMFDFLNNVFGNVGLWDKYDDTAKAGYVNTRNLHISGFDVGRVNATGDSEVWNGAYRETYDTFIQLNRCGCVFINGATHDKYYGGVISANSEIGIWAEAPRVQYNNINFIGTTIEGNGSFDLSASINNVDYKNNISIFAGANTTINLIGSYCEAMMSYAKDGGVINKIGSYEHYNSLNYANNGSINIIASNLGMESKVTFIPKERVLWSRMARGTLAPLTYPDGVVATANTSSNDGFALISRPIPINSAVKNKDIKRIKISFSYKFTSGFTANTDLYIVPKMNLYSKTTGKVDTVPGGIFPLNMLTGRANGEQQSFEYYYKPGNSLDAGGYFDAIELYFTIMNGGDHPNFTSDNLRLEVYNVAISVMTNKSLDIVFNVDKGNKLQRPMLNTEDRGYQYYDYSEGSLLVWNGEDWLDNLTAIITTTSALKAISNPINTARKYVGKTVYCTDTTKFYMAVGYNPGSAWIPTDGTPMIIPV